MVVKKGQRSPEYFQQLHRKAVRKKAQQMRRAILSSQGKCHRCQTPVKINRKGRNLCQSCSDKGTTNTNTYRSKRIDSWKALGLCTHCFGKRESVPGTTVCAYCAEQDYERRLIRQEELRSQAVCLRCCDPKAVHGFFKSTGKRKKYCIACLNKYNNDYRKIKRANQIALRRAS